MSKSLLLISTTVAIYLGAMPAFADGLPEIVVVDGPPPIEEGLKAAAIDATAYGDTNDRSDRVTYVALMKDRGTTTPIDSAIVGKLCGDKDGCSVRLGMHNWDSTGRVASREFLVFYNASTHVWRASQDAQATDGDQVTQHLYFAWACYLTDGQYSAWADRGDAVPGLGLLSWNQAIADCFVTFID